MKKILLVEDDTEITELIDLHFDPDIYKLTCTDNGKDALKKIADEDFDLIILDINLPESNGLEICKKIRRDNLQTPIMMLTSRDRESDKVLALDLGADDYVTKPFATMEFMARVKALLRRADQHVVANPRQTAEIVFNELRIDKDKRKASLKGERLNLTPTEFDLLLILASNPGKTFTREELLSKIWGESLTGYKHTITTHINRLRIKIEENLDHPKYILTSRGTGYRFAE